MRSSKKPECFCRRGVGLVLAIVVMLSIVACSGKQQEEPLQGPLQAPEEEIVIKQPIEIETKYGIVKFPEELSANMRHMEVVEEDIALNVFYMLTAAGEYEVYRIYYADPNVGTHMGYLKTDDGEISVTYALSMYEDADFSSEEDVALYHNMMNAFSVVMNSICEDSRFRETKAEVEVGSQEVKLHYWTVNLPVNVQYQEVYEGDDYRVDFFGVVGGARIDLFSIGVGNIEAETKLGFLNVESEQKPVVVQSYNMDGYDTWSKEEQQIIYNMMASLNNIIQTIVSDKNYSEFILSD